MNRRIACRALAAACGLLALGPARAFDPLTSAIGKGVSTALDVRSKDDVVADVEIDAALSRKLVEQKGDDFGKVSILVFARHGVLVGFARSDDIRRRAEELARGEHRLRSLRNDIVVGQAGGSFGHNALLDKKIDLALTTTRGVRSVNMRWKVYGGDVFIIGMAQSSAEANLAVRTVRRIDGVRAVHSSIRVGQK